MDHRPDPLLRRAAPQKLEPALRGWLPFAIGLILLAAVGFLTTRQLVETTSQQQVIETRLRVVSDLRTLHFGITEAGSTQRGYIITRQPVFRARQRDATRTADAGMESLNRLARQRPDLAPLVTRLEREVSARKAELALVDQLLSQGRDREAAERVYFSRMQLDAIRATVNEIALAEEQKLAIDQRQSTIAGRQLLAMVAGSLIMAALLLGASIAAIRRRSAALEAANADVRALAGSLEERVRTRTAELAEANEEIQRFAYVVSHDLRSPLVNIMGFTAEADAARRDAEDFLDSLDSTHPALVTEAARVAVRTDLPESLGFIRAASERMDRLIKAILALSRMGRRRMQAEAVDLGAVAAGILTTQKAQLEAAGAAVHLGALPVVTSDRLAVEQILGNLLDNAVKYLRPGVPGEIRVEARVLGGDRVAVDVRDNGRGIAPADRERVFELFRRAGAQDQPGEGIGLAHVRTLARTLGGTVTLSDGIDGGSCFTLTLPRVMAQAEEESGA